MFLTFLMGDLSGRKIEGILEAEGRKEGLMNFPVKQEI